MLQDIKHIPLISQLAFVINLFEKYIFL